jgi:high affinity Mn2+ porin
MALLSDVFASAVPDGQPLDPAPLRRFRTRSGISLLLDQALADDLGVFARSGSASGNVEAYEFTDVDRSSSAGVWVAGHAWGRARDVVGAATIRNSISNERARFLNAGGLGILVGDGRLPHAGAERILEVYYRLAVASDSHVTLDYQRVTNPAYNRDRGPVSILALRVHTEF